MCLLYSKNLQIAKRKEFFPRFFYLFFFSRSFEHNSLILNSIFSVKNINKELNADPRPSFFQFSLWKLKMIIIKLTSIIFCSICFFKNTNNNSSTDLQLFFIQFALHELVNIWFSNGKNIIVPKWLQNYYNYYKLILFQTCKIQALNLSSILSKEEIDESKEDDWKTAIYL